MNGVSIWVANGQQTAPNPDIDDLYNRYGLILVDKTIEPPKVQTYSVEIPGRDGVLDLTDALAGRPVFLNRKITMKFKCIKDVIEWPGVYSTLMRSIHGKKCNIIFDDDERMYVGRVFASKYNNVGYNLFDISIEADCEPYKYGTSFNSVATISQITPTKQSDDSYTVRQVGASHQSNRGNIYYFCGKIICDSIYIYDEVEEFNARVTISDGSSESYTYNVPLLRESYASDSTILTYWGNTGKMFETGRWSIVFETLNLKDEKGTNFSNCKIQYMLKCREADL